LKNRTIVADIETALCEGTGVKGRGAQHLRGVSVLRSVRRLKVTRLGPVVAAKEKNKEE